jgi:hypothetical protein
MMNELISVIRRIAAGVLLLAAGLMAVAPASAQQRLSLADLQAQITALQAQVSTLQSALTATQSALAAVQGNSVLALNGILSYDAAKQTALFTGIDVQIVNGAPLNVINGRGNLIVGYNSPRSASSTTVCSVEGIVDQGGTMGLDKRDCDYFGGIWSSNHKSGSHNLVVGEGNAYASYGGVVFGTENAVISKSVAVLAGFNNVAAGVYSSVSAGLNNTVTMSGFYGAVGGGEGNKVDLRASAISGGWNRSIYRGRDINHCCEWVAGGLYQAGP